MLVDFDKTFKQKPDKEQLDRIFDRLKREKKCVMCKHARCEKDYEHGYETYHTICEITGLLRDGKNGISCPHWAGIKEWNDGF
ncbi:MAG: hypothetical protein IJR00_08165 [Lachnospiraceae bacterium]|nr:hypothetical protein [Lachnospiraceae bacterium]